MSHNIDRKSSKKSIRDQDDDSDGSDTDDPNSKTAFQAVLETREDEVTSGPLKGHAGSVECVKFFRSSKGPLRVASGSMDATIRVWNPKSHTSLLVLTGHTAPVMCLDAFYLPKNSRGWDGGGGGGGGGGDGADPSREVLVPHLVSGSEDWSVRVWRVEGAGVTGRCLMKLQGHTAPVYGVVCFTDASSGTPRFASSSEDATLRVWDPCWDSAERQASSLSSLSMAGYAVGSSSGAALPSSSMGGHSSGLGSQLPKGCLAVLEGHSGWVNCVATFAVEKTAAGSGGKLSSGSSGHVGHSRLMHDKLPGLSALPSTSKAPGLSPSSSSSSSSSVASSEAAVCSKVAARSAVDLNTNQFSKQAPAKTTAVAGAAAPATSLSALRVKAMATARLVSGSMDMTLRVWDPTGTRLGILKGHKSWVHSVVCFEDGGGGGGAGSSSTRGSSSSKPRCASGSTDRTIRIWDPVKGGAALNVIDAHRAHVWCLSSLLDSQGQVRLLSGSDDKVLRAWDPEKRKGVASGRDHRKSVKACDGIATTPPDAARKGAGRAVVGRYVASGGEDNVVYVKKWGDFMGGVSSRPQST